MQWESLWLNNAIVQFIIENGYGYPTETIEMTTPVMQASFEAGEIDLVTEMWWTNIADWYREQLDKGTIIDLGENFVGSQFWVIPKYVADEYNIRTVEDMKEHWELFKDPEDPSKGAFYNCITGWRCAQINEIKMEAYGLTDYYNIITPGAPAALDAALAGAQKKKEPVFGYYWAPTPLMGLYEWQILEEPPFTEECWSKIQKAMAGEMDRPIDEACAYRDDPVTIVAHASLQEKAPDVVEFLRKMSIGTDPLNRVLAWVKENDIQDWTKAAVYYLRNYEDQWKTWVTPEAYQKVKQALEEYKD